MIQNQFSLEATLDTREPFVIDFLGPPSGVTHSITGTLTLHVQKPVQLKQISAIFIGQGYISHGASKLAIKSELMTMDKVEHVVLDSSTLYNPGEYTFPFQLSLPGDLATTDSYKLSRNTLYWDYYLVSSGTPSSLISRRKETKQRLQIRRVHVEPSSSSETKVYPSMYLHPYSDAYRVKEIQAQAIQKECISLLSGSHSPDKRGKRFENSTEDTQMDQGSVRGQLNIPNEATINKSSNTRRVSNIFVVTNPDTEECSTSWGRETRIGFEIDLLSPNILPTEILSWVKISHGVQFTIIFKDENIKPFVVKAPFTVIDILKDPWTHILDRSTSAGEADRVELPGYGEMMEQSALLDSNTHRVEHADLYRELYPERGELVVPDVLNDSPPEYEREVEPPEPYSEKSPV
ncbi:hypothetical protein BGX27_003944 [Mortierella sp. AM989]|nr:hypothetical protein BGX27_003944 [Mortierella sp. AM989]